MSLLNNNYNLSFYLNNFWYYLFIFNDFCWKFYALHRLSNLFLDIWNFFGCYFKGYIFSKFDFFCFFLVCKNTLDFGIFIWQIWKVHLWILMIFCRFFLKIYFLNFLLLTHIPFISFSWLQSRTIMLNRSGNSKQQ